MHYIANVHQLRGICLHHRNFGVDPLLFCFSCFSSSLSIVLLFLIFVLLPLLSLTVSPAPHLLPPSPHPLSFPYAFACFNASLHSLPLSSTSDTLFYLLPPHPASLSSSLIFPPYSLLVAILRGRHQRQRPHCASLAVQCPVSCGGGLGSYAGMLVYRGRERGRW